MDCLNTHLCMKNLTLVFYTLKCAANLKDAFCVVPKKVEYGSCRYNHSQENNTMMEGSKLLATEEGSRKHRDVAEHR